MCSEETTPILRFLLGARWVRNLGRPFVPFYFGPQVRDRMVQGSMCIRRQDWIFEFFFEIFFVIFFQETMHS